MMGQDLLGFRALVTGGTRGIGLAIAQRLQNDGAEVTVSGTKAVAHLPEGIHYIPINFLDSRKVKDFVKQVNEMDVDILVNNAGINKISKFEDINPDDFDDIQQVNVRVPFLLCRAVIPGMKKKGWGRIVNIASIFGKVTREYRGSYSASKFALDGMTTALAMETAKFGILANCVAPGITNTELTSSVLGEKGMMDIVSRIPIGRLGNTEEIAAFVVWLAGPENTYITGQNIAIDGGYTRV